MQTPANPPDHHSPARRRPDGKRVAPDAPAARNTAPGTQPSNSDKRVRPARRRHVKCPAPAVRRRRPASAPSAPRPAHRAGRANGRRKPVRAEIAHLVLERAKTARHAPPGPVRRAPPPARPADICRASPGPSTPAASRRCSAASAVTMSPPWLTSATTRSARNGDRLSPPHPPSPPGLRPRPNNRPAPPPVPGASSPATTMPQQESGARRRRRIDRHDDAAAAAQQTESSAPRSRRASTARPRDPRSARRPVPAARAACRHSASTAPR